MGALSLDIYVGRDLVLPGGGALNMAWHWRQADARSFRLLSRIGDDRPGVFQAFLDRHAIEATDDLVGHGPSASIDITIRADLQPFMDHFIEGVWADYRLSPAERALLPTAHGLHAVLVEGAIRELERLGSEGLPAGLEVTADFLDFRHYTPRRFAQTMRLVDVGFVGWQAEMHDPALAALRATAHELGRVVVITFGERGVAVFDGRPGGIGDSLVPVQVVPVRGTTVGCGDAFIAGFLEAWHGERDPLRAVQRGKELGARATEWRRPLPDHAYGPEAASALAAADAAAAETARTVEPESTPDAGRNGPASR
jgi:sugar/nucleoside kinase (ribokinase family)